jgi:hypothetical protein
MISQWAPDANVTQDAQYLAAKELCAQLGKNGFEAFLVGGWVRDQLLSIQGSCNDMDIASNATPQQIQACFQTSKFMGESFGVSQVPCQGFQFEVASFRKEGIYSDKRRPDSIEIGTFLEDANRRDFTMNALYFNPLKNQLNDPFLGASDIKSKTIRCVGEAEKRLSEDLLRVLRLFRFAANFDFSIEPKTSLAAFATFPNLNLISQERVHLEIRKVSEFKFQRFVQYFANVDNFVDNVVGETDFLKNLHMLYPSTALALASILVQRREHGFKLPFPAQPLEKADRELFLFLAWIVEEIFPDSLDLFRRCKRLQNQNARAVASVLKIVLPHESKLISAMEGTHATHSDSVSAATKSFVDSTEFRRTLFSIRNLLKEKPHKIGLVEEKFTYFIIQFGFTDAKKLLEDILATIDC